jgi:outer membrane protein assembly factor BamB
VVLGVVLTIILVITAFAYEEFVPGRVTTSSTSPSSSSMTTGSSSTTSKSSVSTGCGPQVGQPSTEWTTYHGNNSRTGYVKTTVACATAGWKSQALDGEVYAEPLVYNGMVVVATENDSVYALNVASGSVVWRNHLGVPMNGSVLQCGNINPTGITATPVIDSSTGTVYVLAFEAPGAHYLVAMDSATGNVRFSHLADPPGANPLVQQERSALSLGNGRVYVLYGGLAGDCGNYHGWVVAINADGSGSLLSYQVPTNREGGLWAPSGAAIDSSGDLFLTTGNGDSGTNFDHGNAVIELSPTLQELGFFAPTDWLQLNKGDTDLGSLGPMLIGHGELFQIGKEGVGYLVNMTNLGGIGGQLFSGQVCSSSFGGAAAAGSLLFVPCTDGLVALNASSRSFSVIWRHSGYPSGPPIVTGGVVWALDTSSGSLHGYQAQTGSQLFSFQTSHVTRFATPSVGEGRVFVAAGDEVFSFQIGINNPAG